MATLPIVTYNDPVLRQKSDPVEQDGDELQKLIDDMFETMYNAGGVGLAAPQTGRLIRLFVVDADAVTEDLDEPDLGPMVFINPEIVKTEGEMVRMEEGCLSIPEVRDEVKRPSRCVVSWQNRDFERKQMELSGWLSRVVQHEYDHLNGILFLDHLSAFRNRLHRRDLEKIDSGIYQGAYPIAPKSADKPS